ncbi:hypothetical protein BGZ65_009765, partial [Modicella reniformis]
TNIDSEEDGHPGDSMSEEDMYETGEFEEETASDASDLSEEDLSEEDEEEDNGEDDAVRDPFHDALESSEDDEEDHEEEEHLEEDDDEDDDDDDDDDDDEDEDIDAELQETLDRDEEDGEDMVMEWNGDGRPPVILGEDDIAEVVDDDNEDAEGDGHVDHPPFGGDRDRRHHHHHHSGDEGTEDDEDDGEDEDDDMSGDEDDDDMDDDEDDEDQGGHEDGEEPQRRNNRHNPWNMTSTFVINEPTFRSGRPLFDPHGRRGNRLPGQERGLIWDDIGAEHGRFSYLQDGDLPILRSFSRDPTQASDDVITHPLLAQPANPPTTGNNDGRIRGGARSIGLTDWQAFEELLQGNAEQVLGSILNGGALRAGHGGAFRVEVNNNHSTTLIPLDRPGSHHHHHHHHHHHPGHHNIGDTVTATISIGHGSVDPAAGHKTDAIRIVHDFVPFPTSRRWLQECRMMYGATLPEKTLRLPNHIVNALIPAAKEEERLKVERETKAEAERKRLAEEKRKIEEENRRIKEHEDQEARIAEERAANEREAARRTEAALTGNAGASEAEPERAGSSTEPEGSSTTSTSSAPATTSEPAAPVRRMITIGGEEFDITDSDMDVEFLEALPEDMRREIYSDYLQAHRPAASSTSATSAHRNSERSNSSSAS